MNFINFHTSCRKPEKLYFDRLVLFKAYKVLDEKVQKCYVSWQKWCKGWRKTDSWFFSKNYMRNLVNLMQAVESLKICPLMCYFCRKYVQRSCVVKNDLWFQKWHKEFGEQVVESTFWKKIAHRISSFWTLHCFSEVV